MATLLLPRSLIALFPELPRRSEIPAATMAELLERLDERHPGVRDRLTERSAHGVVIREHINAYVDGQPAAIDTPLGPRSTVHIIPAVSGG